MKHPCDNAFAIIVYVDQQELTAQAVELEAACAIIISDKEAREAIIQKRRDLQALLDSMKADQDAKIEQEMKGVQVRSTPPATQSSTIRRMNCVV